MSYSQKELDVLKKEFERLTGEGSCSQGYSKEELDRLHKELEKANKK